MDPDTVGRIVRDVIARGGFSCELVSVQTHGQVWCLTFRDQADRLLTFDTAAHTPAHLRTVVSAYLETND